MSFSGSNNSNNGNNNESFMCHIRDFVGQTVTIFTTSGGVSGCGFTGIVLSVNCDFVRLASDQGTPPANPLSESICGHDNGGGCGSYNNGIGSGFNGTEDSYDEMRNGNCNGHHRTVGSICDIPIDKIAAFCHNAV